MHINTILAIIIVLICLISFVSWVLLSMAALSIDGSLFVDIFVPGVIAFGFWGLVSYRLYNCSCDEKKV